MFTGLIESVGEIARVEASPAGARLHVRTVLGSDLSHGESLSVNGVCLTVVSGEGGEIAADVSPETLRITTLGRLETGALVNLERSMRADARFGGHFVQGHVDGTGTILQFRPEGESHRLSVEFPSALAPMIVHKGSVAVDGISLTVAVVLERVFEVQIIPFTFEHTNLRAARAGDPVNIECDILGKYVARALELRETATGKR